MISPYSDNIIFLDTEFTDLDVRKGELMSIGLIKTTGEELYLELEYTDEPHPWVVENVIPTLTGKKVKKVDAILELKEFVGTDSPFMVAYVNQFDSVFWYDLFGSAKEHPFYWIPIDFASILFAHGLDPNSMGRHKFFESLGIDKNKYNKHNALDDAKLLAETYTAFFDALK